MNKEQLKKIKNRRLTKKEILIMLIILLGIVAGVSIVVWHSMYVTFTETKKQLEQNLADVSRQNAVIIDAKIDSEYRLITSLSIELKEVTKDNIQEKLDSFNQFIDDYELKRFAFCFPDGTTYSTDGNVEDLSYRDFYKAGMEGKGYITGVLTDALKEEHTRVNVMTIPVYNDEKEIVGVFGVAFDTDVFNETMQVESLEGEGFSSILNENGEILATIGGEKLELSKNLIDDILVTDNKNKKAINKLQKAMMDEEEAKGTLYLNDEYYYFCTPVEIMDGSVTWYVLTMVPVEVIGHRVDITQKNQYFTSFIIICLVLLGTLLVVLFMWKQSKKLLQFAYEDPITEGENYVKFCMEMENRTAEKGYLLTMDIANFNHISVVAGEQASEEMIKATWSIISQMTKKDELAAHIRDDRFILFLLEEDEGKLLTRLKKMSDEITRVGQDWNVYGIQTRCGIYLMPLDETLDTAYGKTLIAIEEVIVKEDLQYAFYDEDSREKMQYEKLLEERFPEAIINEEFEVWYQPKYSANDCVIVGSEALVRWRKPDGSMISPGQFIPLFERNGMIAKLDEYMFRMVCKQQKEWLQEGKKVYPVSINVSRASLYRTNIQKHYSKIMKKYNLDSKYIQIEITETVMEAKTNISDLLNKFRDMGVKILMDDFGTGYSSFATLSSQCFDTLKLDKTLIDMIGNRDGETMLYHIIRMGKQMGLHITAEGVEREAQLQFLQTMECDDIQGFYFSKPIPAKDYEELINQERENLNE